MKSFCFTIPLDILVALAIHTCSTCSDCFRSLVASPRSFAATQSRWRSAGRRAADCVADGPRAAKHPFLSDPRPRIFLLADKPTARQESMQQFCMEVLRTCSFGDPADCSFILYQSVMYTMLIPGLVMYTMLIPGLAIAGRGCGRFRCSCLFADSNPTSSFARAARARA